MEWSFKVVLSHTAQLIWVHYDPGFGILGVPCSVRMVYCTLRSYTALINLINRLHLWQTYDAVKSLSVCSFSDGGKKKYKVK